MHLAAALTRGKNWKKDQNRRTKMKELRPAVRTWGFEGIEASGESPMIEGHIARGGGVYNVLVMQDIAIELKRDLRHWRGWSCFGR